MEQTKNTGWRKIEIMINKKNISQNIQAADIAQKTGLTHKDAVLICEIAGNIEKYSKEMEMDGE